MKTICKKKVSVVGGAGHIGLPLSLVFANSGFETLIYDINEELLRKISDGEMPFKEEGGESFLAEARASGSLSLTSDVSKVEGSDFIIIAIGTPVDEFLNPEVKGVEDCLESLIPFLKPNTLIVLRSTLCPDTTDWVSRILLKNGKNNPVAYCPERVVQGRGIEEIRSLPQIVSGTTPLAEDLAAELFAQITNEVVRLKPKEAEFAKLFSNAFRYIEFAASNQFFMLASEAGVDYDRVLSGMTYNYPRMKNIPGSGFAAGPCLFKDTMQLCAYYNNQFALGMDAMSINEGLPSFVVDRLQNKYNLKEMTVGLLGMAFKADSDDPRSSLSYKLKKILQRKALRVLTTDPNVRTDPELVDLSEVVNESDLLILCTPHTEYKSIETGALPVVDVWNLRGKGTLF